LADVSEQIGTKSEPEDAGDSGSPDQELEVLYAKMRNAQLPVPGTPQAIRRLDPKQQKADQACLGQ
jgi:hypothetical protein